MSTRATKPSTATRRRAAPAAPASAPPFGAEGDPRRSALCEAPVRGDGRYVLYWCRAQRRAHDSLALDFACQRADELGLPLLVYEALDARYPHANARVHRFVLEGVAEQRAAIEARGASYAFYLPRSAAEARASRALARLAERAALVVTDAYPHAGGPGSLWARSDAALARLGVRVEAYDDATVVPLAWLTTRHEVAARTLRPRFLAALPSFLAPAPERTVRARLRELALPFEPTEVRADDAALASLVASCAIDHAVAPVPGARGGAAEAARRLERFVREALAGYASRRNDMGEERATTGLSAHLHFGHASPRAVALAVRRAAGSAPHEGAEALLEELLVRRALAFNHVATEPLHHTYEGAAPAWARATLEAHAGDPRQAPHTRDDWERARTADPLWNAAQRELLRDGVIQPYARMLWGKAGITLAPTPREAFAWLCYLNDKYALDGRDPNTYGNIAWCFGQHDHPYPERAVFGTVRSMTSRAAAQKWHVERYLARVGAPPLPKGFARG